MQLKERISVFIFGLLFTASVCIMLKYCHSSQLGYAKKYIDSVLNKSANDSIEFERNIDFANGQSELQNEANLAHIDRIHVLEKQIDSMQRKHRVTKQKIKQFDNSDTGFVLAPNEYIQECEDCYYKLATYKKENEQLRFERDSYDSLLRQSAAIQAERIKQLSLEKTNLSSTISKQYTVCDTTRKLKFSVAGMANSLLLPRAGGFGVIYEDKKFNDFGAHMLFSSKGNIYIFHVAKTISFKRK